MKYEIRNMKYDLAAANPIFHFSFFILLQLKGVN